MSLEPPFTSVYIIYDLCNNLYSKIRRDLFFIDARVSVRLSLSILATQLIKLNFPVFFSISLFVSERWREASELGRTWQIQEKIKEVRSCLATTTDLFALCWISWLNWSWTAEMFVKFRNHFGEKYIQVVSAFFLQNFMLDRFAFRSL